MRPAAAVALAAGAAIAVNIISLVLWRGGVIPELDGAQMLIRVSPPAAVLVSLGVVWHRVNSGSPPRQSVRLAIAAGVLTFALAWVPVVVLFVLHPPS